MRFSKRTVVTAAVAVVLAGAAAARGVAQQADPWIHVEVNGYGDDAERVNLNLPLGAVEAALAVAPGSVLSLGRLHIGQDQGVSVDALRQTWRQLRDAGDTEFLTVEENGETMRVARVGQRIEVRVGRDGETAWVDLPIEVVDALLSGDGETLNIAAAVEELRAIRGDIVRIREDDRRVRVWVDEVAQQ